MKRRKPKRLKATTLFDPDKIVTSMSQKLTLDLIPPEQMYGGDERTLKVFRETQLAAFCKKYVNQAGVANDSLEEKTFEKFLSVNSHMEAYRGISFPTVDHPRQTKCNAEKILLRARALMHFVIGSDFGFDEFFQDCKHGPGTTVGVPFEDTSMEQKFTYPISVTEDAKPLMEQYLLWDDRLTAAIERLNAGYYGNRYCEVQGSRATTVPKSNDIRRMIAVEPSANMFLQQGMMTMMYRRMKAVGLDVETLPLLHKRLALEGSLSGALATVDFSSASDCVSTELLRWLIPPRWFRVYDMIRCKSMKVGDQWVDLNMS